MSDNPKDTITEAMLDRRHLLDCNFDKVLDAMRRSGLPEPVGYIVDTSDHQGRQFAIHMNQAAGDTEAAVTRQIDETNAEYLRNWMTPTLITISSMEAARVILPCTSPTALQSLKTWEAQRQPGHRLVVVIASGGNTYASVELPLAQAGTHRASTKGP